MVKKLSCVCCGILKHFPHTFTTEQCLLKLAVQWRPLYLCHHFFIDRVLHIGMDCT